MQSKIASLITLVIVLAMINVARSESTPMYPTFPAFPNEISFGFLGTDGKNITTTGWTYFDIVNRAQRIDYTFPNVLVTFLFTWGPTNAFKANYTGFLFQSGEISCENGHFLAPFPYPGGGVINPGFAGVQIIEGFGPCYGWILNLGPYSGVFYTQISNSLPALLYTELYQVRYFQVSDSYPANTMAPLAECVLPPASSKKEKLKALLEDNDYFNYLIARDTFVALDAIYHAKSH